MVPYEFNAERFSRWMAYVLRHNPARYGLEADRHGYVDLEAFIAIAKRRYPTVDHEELRRLIASGEGRFHIADGRLRARYGHSIPAEPVGPPVEPPLALYHGTEAGRIATILAHGLQPQDRQMLHVSEDLEDAVAVARRKTEQPAVIKILAREAAAAGLVFYREGKVYLVAHVPAPFLQLAPQPNPAPDPAP